MEHSNTLKEVVRDLKKREEVGFKKYSTTVDRTDLTLRNWLQHAYEETLDKAMYLKAAMRSIDNASDFQID